MARRKADGIHVHVASYGEGRNLCLRYRDPITGKAVVKTAGTTNRTEAQKEAGKWEEDLRSGRYKPASKVTWTEFRARYEREYVSVEMKETSELKVSGVFEAVERIINPELLSAVNKAQIEKLAQTLRDEPGEEGESTRRAEATIRGHLAVLKAALNWALEQGLLTALPKITMPKRAKGKKLMKGRPITGEEFDRLIANIKGERPEAEKTQWENLLWGLWWSGLRLDEAINLTWDDDNRPRIELEGEDSTITIPGDCQKSGEDSVGPIVPEFYEFLMKTPAADRTGYVFPLPFRRKDTVSKVISAIGKLAGVKVNTDGRTGKVKYASAHDCRRAFGFRWALRVMPALLQKLMRHANIDTTLKFYVGSDAKEMGKAAWAAWRTSQQSSNTTPKEATV